METEILQIIQSNPGWAYLAVFGMLLACGLGVPLPEDITLIAGGYTVYLSQQNGLTHPALVPMIIVGMVGVLSGDVTLFLLGRWSGPRITRAWPFKHLVPPHRLERVYEFFRKYGAWTAFIARFAAGLRAPTFLLAGTAHMRFRVFIAADGSAALLSVPLLVWLAWAFGAQIDRVKLWLANSKYAALGIAAVIVAIILYKLIKTRLSRPPPDEHDPSSPTAPQPES